MKQKRQSSLYLNYLSLRARLYLLWMVGLASLFLGNLACVHTNTVEYRVIFNSTWSSSTHPDNFPSNPHFSGLIGVTHNEIYKFWEPGAIASDGIEEMAETGGKTKLSNEINQGIRRGEAEFIISRGSIKSSPGFFMTTFYISEGMPFVSLVSMVAPSPDWFVGVSGLNLREDNEWVKRKTVELFVYDAGTDSGLIYTSPNQDTFPRVPIYKIADSPFFVNGAIRSVGTFTFILFD